MVLALKKTTAVLSATAAIAILSSCAQFTRPAPEPEPAPPPEPVRPPAPKGPPVSHALYDWNGSGQYVSHIEISIDEQKAHFYNGDKQLGWTTVASGVHRYPTPTGSFEIIGKVEDKRSNLYGKIYDKNGKLVKSNAKNGRDRIPAGGRFKGAPMPFFMRLTNDGIGMHGGPIPRPGNRASHGCIRMPRGFAPILFRHVPIGTPVAIQGSGPSYASYLSRQRTRAKKRAPAKVEQAVVATEQGVSAQPSEATSTTDAGTTAPSVVANPSSPTEVQAPSTAPVPTLVGAPAAMPAEPTPVGAPILSGDQAPITDTEPTATGVAEALPSEPAADSPVLPITGMTVADPAPAESALAPPVSAPSGSPSDVPNPPPSGSEGVAPASAGSAPDAQPSPAPSANGAAPPSEG
ncbi:MAG: L,D-transpeptidase family protein [Pseudomonadota bacterium]|nr:L,D-transpeptidase family protein [Pseudomonadota bacterium]